MRSLVFLALLAAIALCRADALGADTPPPAPPAPAMIWGIGGHPTWADYAEWVPGNMERQVDYIRQLGCTYYRCSFEGSAYPAILKNLVPAAQAAGVTLLPDLPLKIVAAQDAKTNYDTDYQIGFKWASYAIAQKYRLPYWELGNELENWKLVSVVGDGTGPDEFPDKTPGGFVAMVAALNGADQGIKDAYAAGRAQGATDVVPQMLFGACYHHWGLLTKIQKYNGSLPFDIISWHWYEPNCGLFTAPLNNAKSFSNGRSPAACLADFKSPTNPNQPMDVWITELNRSINTPLGFFNGSASPDKPQGADWADEAHELQSSIQDLKKAPTVKAIFVYELLDERRVDGKDPKRLRTEGCYGLVTGLDGQYKDAFYTYQNEIKENH